MRHTFGLFYFFQTGFLYVALAALKHRDLPSSVSQVLGLKVCATTHPQQNILLFFFSFFFFFKDLFSIICKYTVAVFRHTRRGSQILLRMAVSHHVVAGI
jgi:hypothetical protein